MPQLTSSVTPARSIDTANIVTERIKGEFREMPGLTLTAAQARRLWSMDAAMCDQVLDQLVVAGVLCRKGDGVYCRSSDFSAQPFRMAKAGIRFVDGQRSRYASR